MTPEQRELLRRNVTIDGDGNVVGNNNTVCVVKQNAGNYAVQIGEQHIAFTIEDLRHISVDHGHVGVIGDYAHIDQFVVHAPPRLPIFEKSAIARRCYSLFITLGSQVF